MTAIGYVLGEPFDIDDGELDGLSLAMAFTLGVEWAQFRATLMNVPGQFEFQLHVENAVRFAKVLIRHNRDGDISDDEDEDGWCVVNVTGQPRLRVVEEDGE